MGWRLAILSSTSASQACGSTSFILQVSIKRGVDGPISPALVGPGEQMVLAPERDGPHGALDDVVVDFDAAVVEIAGQARPARERVADRLGELSICRRPRRAWPPTKASSPRGSAWRAPGGRPVAPEPRDPGYRVRWRRGRRSAPAPRRRSAPGSRPGYRRSFAARAPSRTPA